MTAFSLAHSLAGPIGGVVGIAFGAGSVAGYGFAIRTVLKSAKTQLAEMKTQHGVDRAEWKAERERDQQNFREEMARERADCDRRMERMETRLQLAELTHRIGPNASVGDIRQESQRGASARSVARRMADLPTEPDPDQDRLIAKLRDHPDIETP